MFNLTNLQQSSQCVLYLDVIGGAFSCQVLVLSECDIAAEITLTVGRCTVPDKLNIFLAIHNNCCLFAVLCHLLMYFSRPYCNRYGPRSILIGAHNVCIHGL